MRTRHPAKQLGRPSKKSSIQFAAFKVFLPFVGMNLFWSLNNLKCIVIFYVYHTFQPLAQDWRVFDANFINMKNKAKSVKLNKTYYFFLFKWYNKKNSVGQKPKISDLCIYIIGNNNFLFPTLFFAASKSPAALATGLTD